MSAAKLLCSSVFFVVYQNELVFLPLLLGSKANIKLNESINPFWPCRGECKKGLGRGNREHTLNDPLTDKALLIRHLKRPFEGDFANGSTSNQSESCTLASQLAVSRISQLSKDSGRGGGMSRQTVLVTHTQICVSVVAKGSEWGGGVHSAILGQRVAAIKSFLKLIIKPKVGKHFRRRAQPKNEHNELTTLLGSSSSSASSFSSRQPQPQPQPEHQLQFQFQLFAERFQTSNRFRILQWATAVRGGGAEGQG